MGLKDGHVEGALVEGEEREGLKLIEATKLGFASGNSEYEVFVTNAILACAI